MREMPRDTAERAHILREQRRGAATAAQITIVKMTTGDAVGV